MNQKKLLSVIVPCYNVAQWVEKCVASITRQTYKELEIILIDDGSTDNTPSLLDSLAAQDKRIRVIHQKNQGSSITRENGLKASKGAYVTFVDADDRIHEKMYETMVGGLDREQADIAVCGVCDAYPTPPFYLIETQEDRNNRRHILFLRARRGDVQTN